MLSYRTSPLIALSLLLVSAISHAQSAPPAPKPQPPPESPVDPNDPLSALTAPGQPDQSANDKRAKELYVQADVAYAEGKYAMALVLFRESYTLSNRALILIAMANSQERLGDLQGALDNLNTYARQTDITKEPTIEQRILSLESRIKEGAAREAAAKEAAARAEEDRLQRVKQAKEPQSLPATPSPLGPDSQLETTTPRWPWILVGTGSAAILAGASFGLVARSARSSAGSLCTESMGDTLCMPGAQKYLDRDSTFSLLADISVGVGIAAAATGVVFLLLPKDEDTDSGPNIAVGPNSMSVSMQGRF
jgi:hypothetical protein